MQRDENGNQVFFDAWGSLRYRSADSVVAQNVNDLMTDAEKQALTGCPYCGTDYAFAGSEVDADSICRVTCGYCERVVEYKIEFVE